MSKHHRDEDCPNCGMVVEVTVWEDGECEHCGATYSWEEYFEEDDDYGDIMIIWR